jgi:hypothetical protein
MKISCAIHLVLELLEISLVYLLPLLANCNKKKHNNKMLALSIIINLFKVFENKQSNV